MLSVLRAMARWAAIWLLPVALVAAIFWAVLHSGPAPFPRTAIPKEPYVRDRCTWICHNRGCRHPARLPGWLTDDSGLFGQTVGALHQAGSAILPTRPNEGYGLVNLLLFCVVWPGAMWLLLGLALNQRLRLRELRRSRRGNR